MDTPLAASRRVKDNRWHNSRIEIAPPVAPPLPGQKQAVKRVLEEAEEIKTFLHDEGPVSEGVRRVVLAVREKRRTLGNEWDVRASVAKFVKDYAYAVPNADKEYLRGMALALKVYLASEEA